MIVDTDTVIKALGIHGLGVLVVPLPSGCWSARVVDRKGAHYGAAVEGMKTASAAVARLMDYVVEEGIQTLKERKED